jgi:hypothetical protein
MRPLVISICIVLTVAVVSATDNWPHFRFNGGVADDDPRLPDRWTATENVAWKTLSRRISSVPCHPPRCRRRHLSEEGETSNAFVAWSNPVLATYLPSAISYRGQICNLYSRRLFTCHDAKPGKEIYGRQRIDPQASGFSASPWAHNGRIFVASEDGDVYVIEAGPAFRILHKNSMGEMIGSGTPAIAKGSVIIRTASALWEIAKAGTP